MPRPQKRRRICSIPRYRYFAPQGERVSSMVTMTLDEYECIRLIDWLEYTQAECSEQMGVARTTVQAMYDRARKKMAEALVQGKELVISGGEYWVCPHNEGCIRKKCCKRQQMGENCKSACDDIERKNVL